MKKIFFFLLLAVLLVLFTSSQAKAENISVTAIVPSKVSKEKSKIETNTKETLADPINHSILLRIVLYDKDNNPLPHLPVEITTTRGEIDILEVLTGQDIGIQNQNGNKSVKGKTEADGSISFRITSFMPGEATIYIKADNLIDLDPITIKFLPLPFPAGLTVTLPLPFSQKEIILLSPQEQEQKLTPQQKEAKKLINTGTKINIPFWFSALLVILLLGAPIFIVLNFINLRKLRKTEKQETELLKKIATATSSELKKELKDGGFDHDGILDQGDRG